MTRYDDAPGKTNSKKKPLRVVKVVFKENLHGMQRRLVAPVLDEIKQDLLIDPSINCIPLTIFDEEVKPTSRFCFAVK